jgi:hypothetical protein
MKNQTKPTHTKGPWRSEGPTEVNAPISVVKDTLIGGTHKARFFVATVHRASVGTEHGGIKEAEANAHLIAAAPELLQAIERLLNTPALANPENLNNYDASALNEAYQAIKKARGSL